MLKARKYFAGEGDNTLVVQKMGMRKSASKLKLTSHRYETKAGEVGTGKEGKAKRAKTKKL